MTFTENYSQATKQTAIYKDVAKSKRHLQDALAQDSNTSNTHEAKIKMRNITNYTDII